MKQSPNRRKRTEYRRTNAISRRKYSTARWAKVRDAVLARDRGLCQECLRCDRVEPGNEVDHKLRAEDNPELFWRFDNLETLCKKCHSRKTARGG